MIIWRSCIARYLLVIWRQFIAKCMPAIWRHPITLHTLAILATSYCLKRNDRVSSFFWTRWSKLCFSHVSLILVTTFLFSVFVKSLLTKFFVPFLAAWESKFLSCFLYLWHSELVHRTYATPYFWHRTRGFLEVRRSWEPGSRLTTGDFFPFRLSPKVSHANVHWANANHTFLTH
jgi:hypothetical protein